MPVWHATIKKLDPQNLAVLGVVQEQHAERAKLYKQWKQYDFPIAQDSITKLGAAAVPIFIGIDEHGITRSTRIRPDGLKDFLAKKFDSPAEPAPVSDKDKKLVSGLADSSVEEICELGDSKIMFPSDGEKSIDKAIEAYTAALAKDPGNGAVLFRLGVAYRQRYDEVSHDDADFDLASKYWTQALASNPRQYIWRRRIEQYGPRLQKPYPFYDWVETAVKEVKERGEEPIKLTVKLTQSEVAGRSKPDYSSGGTKPDSTENIERDNGQLVSIASTMVPGFVEAGKPATVHLRLVPEGAKWNNESTPLRVWIESDSAKLSAQLLTFQNPNQPDSKEDRQLEFDLLAEGSETRTIKGFALYNVCAEDGVCMFRRQDFEIEVPMKATASSGGQ